MTEEEKRKAKRTIANFMDWIDSPYENTPDKVYSKDLTVCKHLDNFKYFESWDEIMPVIEKIISLGYPVTFIKKDCWTHISIGNIEIINKENSIVTLCLSIIEFIEWYNQHTKS